MSPKRGKHLSCDDFTEKQVAWECGKSTRDTLSQLNRLSNNLIVQTQLMI